MKTTPELSEAVENLYRAFEGYRRRANTEPCSHCHTPEEEHRLHSKPLRNLTADDLKQYAFDALYTWGNEHDFKHFLPRLLELAVALEDPGLDFVDPEALFRKLPFASWSTWPQTERNALSLFMNAMWRAALNSEPEELDWDGVAQWLCALAGCEENLFPYLQMWTEEPSLAAHRNLARVILELGVPYAPSVPMGYWEDRRDQWNQFIAWLKSSAVLEKMEHAIELWPDTDFSEELFNAAVFLKP